MIKRFAILVHSFEYNKNHCFTYGTIFAWPGYGGDELSIKGTGGDRTITKDSIRSRLGGLRSNMFIVEPKIGPDGQPECFIFSGGGWGHGVELFKSY